MSRLLGCAVIGAGRMGAMHASTLFSLPNVRLTAVVDPDQAAAVAAAEDRLAASRIDAALRNPGVDAVVIASPTELHAEHVIAAARAGKAIFCEKPLSLDLAQAEEAIRVVEETQVPFQMGFQRRYDTGHAAAQARLASLGRLEVVRLQSSGRISPSVAQCLGSGGLFFGFAVDDIDLARFHGGDIDEVSVVGACFSTPASTSLDDTDTAIITLRFTSGALGVIHVARQADRPCEHRAELQCEHGRLVVEREQATPLRVYDSNGIHLDIPDTFERYRQSYVDELAAFVESVREGRTLTPGPQDALAALRAATACATSLREGRTVRLSEIGAARN